MVLVIISLLHMNAPANPTLTQLMSTSVVSISVLIVLPDLIILHHISTGSFRFPDDSPRYLEFLTQAWYFSTYH